MLEPRPACQQVVGDVQDVVRLVVRQVNLEQAEPIIVRSRPNRFTSRCAAPMPPVVIARVRSAISE
jgi:hypothetical protein